MISVSFLFIHADVIFHARITKEYSWCAGVRMLDGQATDILEGSSLSFQSDYIDIYSNCWGPKDDGKTFGKPGKLAQEALMQGALKASLLLLNGGHVVFNLSPTSSVILWFDLVWFGLI